MDLQLIAEADLAITLEGDGKLVALVSPDGTISPIKAISNDISLLLDPETGVPMSGRNANAAFRMSSVLALGLGLPVGVPDSDKSPWGINYTTVTGDVISTKVIATNPDRSIGILTMSLELLK